MPQLDALPSGTNLVIDANIFLEHFLRRQPDCSTFLERLWSGEIVGVTSVLVLAEVRHGLLRAEASAQLHLPSRKTVRYLREHPERIARLTETKRALSELKRWPVRVVHLTRGHFWRACLISERYGLLTNDALHVATLRAHGLDQIASADRDFRLVPHLTLWTP
jgi:predicted nucleic acid-binding protein